MRVIINLAENQSDAVKVKWAENFDLTNIVTSVNIDVFEHLLREANYDESEVNFITDGFRHGFSLGYQGPMNIKVRAPNLKFQGAGDEVTLWNKVIKEIEAKRYAGPFEEIPFEFFIQSPIRLVPKDGGKDTRLIFHLSYPRQKNSTSINANTPKELCTVKYPDFNQAIQLCLLHGKKCRISRSDVKMAFRNLGIKSSHWCLLVMKAKCPLDGKTYFLVDKALPFGASILRSHFQRVSNGVSHLASHKTGHPNINYLDDYLFCQLLKAFCNGQVKVFMDICKAINLPVNIDKTFWATTVLTFLGMLIDTVNQRVSIPIDKIEKALAMITELLSKRKCTLVQL